MVNLNVNFLLLNTKIDSRYDSTQFGQTETLPYNSKRLLRATSLKSKNFIQIKNLVNKYKNLTNKNNKPELLNLS